MKTCMMHGLSLPANGCLTLRIGKITLTTGRITLRIGGLTLRTGRLTLEKQLHGVMLIGMAVCSCQETGFDD